MLRIPAYCDESGLFIEVSDTGVGIPAENREKIFSHFFTTKTTGVGLGLAYVKDTVEAHGGTVSYMAVAGEGTTFTIRIPME